MIIPMAKKKPFPFSELLLTLGYISSTPNQVIKQLIKNVFIRLINSVLKILTSIAL